MTTPGRGIDDDIQRDMFVYEIRTCFNLFSMRYLSLKIITTKTLFFFCVLKKKKKRTIKKKKGLWRSKASAYYPQPGWGAF